MKLLLVEDDARLAQAMRAVQANSIDRFVGNLGQVAQFKPDVLDKFDADQWVDLYADSLGVDPQLIVPADQVQALRAQRAQAAQAQAMTEQMAQRADMNAKLASADTSKQNALTDMNRALAGATQP